MTVTPFDVLAELRAYLLRPSTKRAITDALFDLFDELEA